MAATCLQTAAMPHPLRPETDRSSYTNQPPTWQLHAFRQLPPGLRKPSKEHFLIFHRYSTELFRGWTCLLDFCKLLANMGLWKIELVSAFGKPDASKMINVSAFCKIRYSTRYSLYICDLVELIFGFSSKSHVQFGYSTRCSSYIYVFLRNFMNMIFHAIFLTYICVFVTFSCLIFYAIFHIYKAVSYTHLTLPTNREV